jgi:zinc transporter 6
MAFKLQDFRKTTWRAVGLLFVLLPFSICLFYWCRSTNSLALSSFAYLTLFNIGSLLNCALSVWVSKQQPTPKFSYGLERLNVLAVFSTTIILILAGLNQIKLWYASLSLSLTTSGGEPAVFHCSSERLFDPPQVSTDNMFLAVFLGLTLHLTVMLTVDNKPLAHAAHAATPNWLQNMLNDVGHSVGSMFPGLGHLLLLRLNPISLLALGQSLSVLTAKIFIDFDELYLADVAGALFNTALICGTMLPLSIYCGKILLQTAPEHILPLLDKSLREVSALDGVLELKGEHFWTIAFGSYAGSVHVRVRREADEQEVLSQVHSCLSSQMNDLTVQVMKDDLIIPAAPPTNIPVGVVSPTLPPPPPHQTHSHSHSHSHSHATPHSVVVNL